MDHLVALSGEVIRVRPEAAAGGRRRLLVERPADHAEHFAVKVTSLHSEGCAVSGPQALAELDGKLWLKLPGFEPIQLTMIVEESERLRCCFAQPLQPAMVQAMFNPRSQVAGQSAHRPRCTFL